MLLISRGYNTFMNGKFVKSWIEKNVGKVIVLVIIDTKSDTSKDSFYQILNRNGFEQHNLEHFGLLFDYDGIPDDVTIYVKNVENANYVADTNEDLDITDDDRYAYTDENGNTFSCRQIEDDTFSHPTSETNNAFRRAGDIPDDATISVKNVENAKNVADTNENGGTFSRSIIPTPETDNEFRNGPYYDSRTRGTNRDNCRLKCSIMG